jgi:hypothetical protein
MTPPTLINTKLIQSLTQIILSLTAEERALLGLQVGHPDPIRSRAAGEI